MLSRIISVGLLAALPLTAFAAGPVMVKSVDVTIALEDLTNAEAATKFANVEIDLENAIAARLVNRINAENGVEITIDISELELSNSFTDIFNFADTKLVGNVKVKGSAENPDSNNYDLIVDVNTSLPFIPAGTVVETLPVDSEIYYQSLITAFADSVVRKLGE